jgi:hypothetical protein
MSLRIVAAQGRVAQRGNLDAQVRGADLVLPELLAGKLISHRVTTAERLAELAIDLPGSLAEVLGWRPDEVVQATTGLVRALTGHVDAELLRPSPQFERGMGALQPPVAGSVTRRSY